MLRKILGDGENIVGISADTAMNFTVKYGILLLLKRRENAI